MKHTHSPSPPQPKSTPIPIYQYRTSHDPEPHMPWRHDTPTDPFYLCVACLRGRWHLAVSTHSSKRLLDECDTRHSVGRPARYRHPPDGRVRQQGPDEPYSRPATR